MKSSLHSLVRLRVFMPGLLISALALKSGAGAFHNPYGKFPTNATPGDRLLANYFRDETHALAARCLPDSLTAEDWSEQKAKRRQQLFEMLGLDPLPPRTDLKATVTGKLEHPEFTVEKLHFQSMPGLYVTANLYVPRKLAKPAPAILYLCGHAPVKTNGVSYGCKVAYQHHGIWFARNGYVCLVLDTIQLGELEGVHHGTYREGLWWWNSRGYTPAGTEAWNAIRALDYLETRPEVDKERFGVTGRSGGGAYSWWIAAVDDRIKVACPVAGITDLENYVVDGAVEGHCDCMFMINTYRWDYPQVAALVAPRPLLICNTDKDTIFPMDGVVRLYEKVRHVYDLYDACDRLGLLITEGPHRDTQELQVPVLRWFNRFLKSETPLIENAAVPLFTGQQLKVFDQLPKDAINNRCYEHFTRQAADGQPLDSGKVIEELKRETFGGWPSRVISPVPHALASTEVEGVRLTVHEFQSQPGVTLRFYVVRPASAALQALHFEAMDEAAWRRYLDLARPGFEPALGEELRLAGMGADTPVPPELARRFNEWLRSIRDSQAAWVSFTPRGVGLSHLSDSAPYLTHVRRRFMLLGQTLAGMQVWDVRQGLHAASQVSDLAGLPLFLQASLKMTEVATFAALFAPNISYLVLAREPRADKEAPDFLNWSRITTPAQLLGMAGEKCRIQLNRAAAVDR